MLVSLVTKENAQQLISSPALLGAHVRAYMQALCVQHLRASKQQNTNFGLRRCRCRDSGAYMQALCVQHLTQTLVFCCVQATKHKRWSSASAIASKPKCLRHTFATHRRTPHPHLSDTGRISSSMSALYANPRLATVAPELLEYVSAAIAQVNPKAHPTPNPRSLNISSAVAQRSRRDECTHASQPAACLLGHFSRHTASPPARHVAISPLLSHSFPPHSRQFKQSSPTNPQVPPMVTAAISPEMLVRLAVDIVDVPPSDLRRNIFVQLSMLVRSHLLRF